MLIHSTLIKEKAKMLGIMENEELGSGWDSNLAPQKITRRDPINYDTELNMLVECGSNSIQSQQ